MDSFQIYLQQFLNLLGIPYLLVVHKIPKEKYGVYMGIINMMIVIPMLIQNLSFGFGE